MSTLDEHDPAEFRERLEALDLSLFASIKSQTKAGDRASLLSLQAACAERFGTFRYLEIGSHLGGSLQAFMRDERVVEIMSIDLRPEATPDARGKQIPYLGNSTQRMRDLLAAIPGTDLGKLHTLDADTRTLSGGDVPFRPELSFIDGEHTRESCLADARFCRGVAAPDAVIAFHDDGIISGAIAGFLRELRSEGARVRAYPLPDAVFVVELGCVGLHDTRALARLLGGQRNQLDRVARALAAHPRLGGPVRWLLLEAWLSPLGAGRHRVGRRIRKLRKTLRARRGRALRRFRARSVAVAQRVARRAPR